jgi:PAS domain S-box-containing protein
VEGIFELYSDVTPLMGRIERSTAELIVGLLLIFGALYAVLFLIVRRADRILNAQRVALLNKEKFEARNTALEREIGERKQVEEALRESEERLRGIFDNLVVGVIPIDDRGVVQSFNPGAERIFGYAPEEVVGHNVAMLMPEPHRSRHHTYIADYLRTGEAKIIGKGRVVDGRRKDGSTFPMELEIGEMMVGGRRMFTGIAKDITERKQVEKALRESEERFRAVVDNSPTAISLKDTQGRYLLTNKRYEEWFGFSLEDAVGKTCHDLYPEERADIISAEDRKALATGAASERTTKTVFADGTTHTLLVTKFPIPGSDGKPVALCGINTDVTERTLLHEQLAAAQKMEALGQLTGGVAHEFNNLLMVIAANLQLLEEEVEGMESPTRRVQKALKTAFKGGELTQHMLSYVGRQALSPKVIDVNAFVADTVQMLRPMVGETIAIETVTGDDVWPVSVDPGGLDSALLNLVINARDALPGGGKITIETANLRVDKAAAVRLPYKVVPGDYVMLAVVDNGTGMTPHVAERAFDPFFTTKDIGKGTGLGLSRVFGFVRRQSGGYIDIESAPRNGTTVRLYLPRVQAGAGETPEPAEATEEPLRRGATVLVVEDNTEVLGVTVELLEKLGYRVFYANNGRDALTLSEKVDRIDLLLTDVVMPGGMNGVDLAQAIRRTRPATRVVFMSGYPDEATATEGVPESGAPLLHKPFKTGELARVINEVLEGGQDRRTMYG